MAWGFNGQSHFRDWKLAVFIACGGRSWADFVKVLGRVLGRVLGWVLGRFCKGPRDESVRGGSPTS